MLRDTPAVPVNARCQHAISSSSLIGKLKFDATDNPPLVHKLFILQSLIVTGVIAPTVCFKKLLVERAWVLKERNIKLNRVETRQKETLWCACDKFCSLIFNFIFFQKPVRHSQFSFHPLSSLLSHLPLTRPVASSPTSSTFSLSFLLALNGPRWWLADLHGDVRVQRILLDLNQSVGQRADAVLLHCVLGVLYFVESNGVNEEREGRAGREREMKETIKNIRFSSV